MGIVGPSHRVVGILYMNLVLEPCYYCPDTVLRSTVVCRPIIHPALWDNFGWLPVTFIGVSISCASLEAHTTIILPWVCRFVITDTDRQTDVYSRIHFILLAQVHFTETCVPSLIPLFLCSLLSEQHSQNMA